MGLKTMEEAHINTLPITITKVIKRFRDWYNVKDGIALSTC